MPKCEFCGEQEASVLLRVDGDHEICGDCYIIWYSSDPVSQEETVSEQLDRLFPDRIKQ